MRYINFYTDLNTFQCSSGPDFALINGHEQEAGGGCCLLGATLSHCDTPTMVVQYVQRILSVAVRRAAAAMRASRSKQTKSCQRELIPSNAFPTIMCQYLAPDKKNAPDDFHFIASPRKKIKHDLNLPLHIPEPLSMTRAAISSSSAMVSYWIVCRSCVQK